MNKLRRTALYASLAIVLVLLVACGGGGDAKEPGVQRTLSTTTATAPSAKAKAQPRTVKVAALSFSWGPNGAFGETLIDRITVGPSNSGELKVSFAESEVRGIGPSLTSSSWTAIAVASLLLGVDPRQYEFTFEPVGGHIDGPSSSGLYTVGILAAILGDNVRRDVAMTGTINPDGTIGPVGGIPHKIQGAAEAGMAIALIPTTKRFDIDRNTGQPVDIVELGARLGVEVIPVSSVQEAYHILTGNPFPQPEGTGSIHMPPAAFDKLKDAAIEWLGRYEAALDRFLALSDTLGYEEDILIADQMAAAADNALWQGLAAVAYERAFSAASIAEGALQAVDLAEAYLTGGIDGLIREAAALSSAETRLAATLERLAAETPSTATDVIALMDAYSNVAIALGLVNDASSLVQLLGEIELTEEETLDLIFNIAANYSQADFFLDAAEDNLAYGLGFGVSPPPDPEVITAIAETLRRAADANLAVIDSLLLEDLVKGLGTSIEGARTFFLSVDSDYAAALGATSSTKYFRNTILGEPQASIAVLGGSLSAWASSALVVSKYFSLDAKLDENFAIVGFANERALSDMLDLAHERARQLIALVAEEEPVSALYYHENARSYREGTQFDKIAALFYNWQAAVLGEALAYFNGAYDIAIGQASRSPLWQWGAAGEDRRLPGRFR